jgi:beta-lactamase class A
MSTLRARLDALGRRAGGTFAFYINDLRRGQVVRIRDQVSFPAASLIKVPIMLALLERVRLGEAQLTDTMRMTSWHRTGGAGVLQHFHDGLEVTLEDACTAMIVLSDNTATNMVLDAVGIERVNALLDAQGCPRTRLHRYLGKPEMPGPPGPSQLVPEELGHLLEEVWKGSRVTGQRPKAGDDRQALLTPELCRRALLFLRRQQHRALAPRLLPEGTVLAHKTGSLDGVRHDAGLIWLPEDGGAANSKDPMALPDDGLPDWEPVVFVAMSKDVPDLRWTVENRAEVTVARAMRAVYDELSA